MLRENALIVWKYKRQFGQLALPLYRTPWPLRWLYPWRVLNLDGTWDYVSHAEYRILFTKDLI